MAKHPDIVTAVDSEGDQPSRAQAPLALIAPQIEQNIIHAIKALKLFASQSQASLNVKFSQTQWGEVKDEHLKHISKLTHQNTGALAMCGQPILAKISQAMELACDALRENGVRVTPLILQSFSLCGQGLVEFIHRRLRNHRLQELALFESYAALRGVGQQPRVHPVDLWSQPFSQPQTALQSDLIERRSAETTRPQPFSDSEQFDNVALSIIRPNANAVLSASDCSLQMMDLCLTFAKDQADKWVVERAVLTAALFETLGCEPAALNLDLHLKKTVLQAFTWLKARMKLTNAPTNERSDQPQGGGNEPHAEHALAARELLFCLAQVAPSMRATLPLLYSVLQHYDALHMFVQDYRTQLLGHFDPSLVTQCQKKTAELQKNWTAMSNGDMTVAAQLIPVCDDLCAATQPLHADAFALTNALRRAISKAEQHAAQVPTELEFEVSSTILYLQLTFEDYYGLDDTLFHARCHELIDRLSAGAQGLDMGAIPSWIEQLYQLATEKTSRDSVLGELKSLLHQSEIEIDAALRTSGNYKSIAGVNRLLQKAKNILSVLGLDHAQDACSQVMQATEAVAQARAAPSAQVVAGFTANLSALGFMVDMMAYQPLMAKHLFVFDPQTQRFEAKLHQTRVPESLLPQLHEEDKHAFMATQPFELDPEPARPNLSPSQALLAARFESPELDLTFTSLDLDALPSLDLPDILPPLEPLETLAPALTTASLNAQTMSQASFSSPDDDEQASIVAIFLEEASLVTAQALGSVEVLQVQPQDLSELAVLRRAFHTLKGSARIVGLTQFGEAAWITEKLLNQTLAAQAPIGAELLAFCKANLTQMSLWSEQLAQAHDLTAFNWDLERIEQAAAIIQTAMDKPPSRADRVLGEASDFLVPPLTGAADSVLQMQDPFLSTAWSNETINSENPPFISPEAAYTDQYKVIGSLRIDFDTYNQYLLETDEWSRSLLHDLSEWALEGDRPAPVHLQELTHALAVSSERVGFDSAAVLARQIHSALIEVSHHGKVAPAHPQILASAAAALSDLLHQFAAGFLADIPHSILDGLESIHLQPDTVYSPLTHLDPAFDTAGSYAAHEPSQQLITVFHEEADELLPELGQALQRWALQPNDGVAKEETLRILHTLKGSAKLVDEHQLAQAAHDLESYIEMHLGTLESLENASAFDHALHRFDAMVAAFEGAPNAAPAPDSSHTALDPNGHTKASETNTQLLELSAVSSDALSTNATLPVDFATAFAAVQPKSNLERDSLLDEVKAARSHITPPPPVQPSAGEALHAVSISEEPISLDPITLEPKSLEPISTRPQPASHELQVPDPLLPAPVSGAVDLSVDALSPASLATAEMVAPPTTRKVKAGDDLVLGTAPSQAVIRIRTQLIDRLVNQTGEVAVARSRIEGHVKSMQSNLQDLSANLERIRSHLRELDLQTESQLQSRQALTHENPSLFDPLEFDRFTRSQELTRMLAESVNDVASIGRNMGRYIHVAQDDLAGQARHTRSMQQDLLRTRMVEFNTITDRLHRLVRQTSLEQGKQVELRIEQGQIELDRSVLERTQPAFEHLIRNSIVHGIEQPQDREALGKNATGQIFIQIKQDKNDVAITLSDDGQGLNLQAIQAKALALDLIKPGHMLTADEAVQIIYRSGFSTAEKIDANAGRGVGMDAVRNQIQAIGGRIDTASTPGHGIRFNLSLPLTTAVTQVVLLRTGELITAVPSNLIETVLRIGTAHVDQARTDGEFTYHQQVIPFFWLGNLLQHSTQSTEGGEKHPSVVILKNAAQSLALQVDEVVGNTEAVIKNLGSQLSKLPGLSGMTLLPSGKIVLIYNPIALAAIYGDVAKQRQIDAALAATTSLSPQHDQAVAKQPLVMVVDDSVTMRKVLQRFLLREGYRVSLVNDGAQAWQELQHEKPSLLLTDVEMPQMDGFELLKLVRQSERLHDLPVVMITSRMADKHRDHATLLGANEYLGKPYREDELQLLVHRYAGPVK